MKNSLKQLPSLPQINISLRVLFTGYLLVTGLGLLVSFGQILLTHGMADKKFGLSIDDIVYSYYGNRGNSRLEEKLNGTMKDKAPTWARADIIKWVRNDSPENQYTSKIAAIFNTYCIKCHGSIPGLANFTNYQNIKKMTDFDHGASINSLTRVSHIHLFGIAFIFFFVCLIFSFTIKIPGWLKLSTIAMPFAFLLIDVLSWWLTKINPNFAILTIAAGFGYALASLFMITTSLYQMWFMPIATDDQI